jgi:hypothetical protein
MTTPPKVWILSVDGEVHKVFRTENEAVVYGVQHSFECNKQWFDSLKTKQTQEEQKYVWIATKKILNVPQMDALELELFREEHDRILASYLKDKSSGCVIDIKSFAIDEKSPSKSASPFPFLDPIMPSFGTLF